MAKRIVLGVTGSIAAYKACDIARRLMENGCQVFVAMTPPAAKLVTPTTFAALTGNAVYADMWDDNAWNMTHIDLAKTADVMLIAPATANTIAKVAHGFAEDPVSSLALATRAKKIIAPAMNEGMFENSFVQENLARLTKQGVEIISPVKGNLACGDVGVGHLADVDVIVNAVLKG